MACEGLLGCLQQGVLFDPTMTSTPAPVTLTSLDYARLAHVGLLVF